MRLYNNTLIRTDYGTIPINLVKEGYKVECFDRNYRNISSIDVIKDNYIFDIILSDKEVVHLGTGSNILIRTLEDIKNGISDELNKIIEVNENTLKRYEFICYRDSWDSMIRNTHIQYNHNYLLQCEDFYSIKLDNLSSNSVNNMIAVKFNYSDKTIFVL